MTPEFVVWQGRSSCSLEVGSPSPLSSGLNPRRVRVSPIGKRSRAAEEAAPVPARVRVRRGKVGSSASEIAPTAISANPGADDIQTGTGALGRILGFDKDSGIRLGGAWVGDANWLMSGGRRPGEWGLNSLTLLDLTVDTEKLVGLKGGLFAIDFLQFSGHPVNEDAGLVEGYNGLQATPPLDRQELYELWYRQQFS